MGIMSYLAYVMTQMRAYAHILLQTCLMFGLLSVRPRLPIFVNIKMSLIKLQQALRLVHPWITVLLLS